jgi:hypothetical protein
MMRPINRSPFRSWIKTFPIRFLATILGERA